MRPVKPVLTEYDLGDRGWRTLHKLARERRRDPRDQVMYLVLFGLDRYLAGQDVELSQAQLEALFAEPVQPVEDVA